MFTICDGSDLSLMDIEKQFRNGVSALRSAHIGNFNAQTLFLAREGIPIVVDEHPLGTMRCYRPGFIRLGGKELQIAQDPTLPATYMRPRFDVGAAKPPACQHYDALTTMFPASVVLTAELLIEQESFIGDALQVLAEMRPHVFRRFIDRDGTVFLHVRGERSGTQVYAADAGRQEHAVKASDLPELVLRTLHRTSARFHRQAPMAESVLLSVDADILLLTLSEVYAGRNGTRRFQVDRALALHFSGLEMMNYLLKNQAEAARHRDELNAAYSALRSAFPRRLPGWIDFQLIPTDMIARFLTRTAEEAARLDSALSSYANLIVEQHGRKAAWKAHSDSFVDRVSAMSDDELAEKIRGLDPRQLPRDFGKQVRRAQEGSVDRAGLKPLVTKILMFEEGAYPELTGHAKRIADIKQELSGFVPHEHVDVTQYDLCAGARIFFPETARSLSQRELRLRWRHIQKL